MNMDMVTSTNTAMTIVQKIKEDYEFRSNVPYGDVLELRMEIYRRLDQAGIPSDDVMRMLHAIEHASWNHGYTAGIESIGGHQSL